MGEARPVVAACLLLLGSAVACASQSVSVPPMDLPFADTPPPDVEASVESTIARSIPEVSYHTPAPRPSDTSAAAVLDPTDSLDPAEMKLLIRRLESLDGDQKILCRPTHDRAYGDCTFPPAQ